MRTHLIHVIVRAYVIIVTLVKLVVGLRFSTADQRSAAVRDTDSLLMRLKKARSEEHRLRNEVDKLTQTIKDREAQLTKFIAEADHLALKQLFMLNLARSREQAAMKLLTLNKPITKRGPSGSFEIAIEELRLWHDSPFEQLVTAALNFKDKPHAV